VSDIEVSIHLTDVFEELYGKAVPPEENPGATYLIVGEAPGENEVSQARPFCGRSGKFLDGALNAVGLRRRQFNIVNVVPFRPPGNDISKWFPKGEPNDAVVEGTRRLRDYIHRSKPRAILALGNTALWALVGKRGISDRRGSIYEWVDDPTTGLSANAVQRIPVLPTLHPAAVLRESTLANLFARDLARFKQLATGLIQPAEPERELVLFPSGGTLQAAVERLLRARFLSVDIETGGGRLQCVGFASEPGFSVCIPADTDERIEAISVLLASEIPKVFHNAPYDVAYLRHHNNARIGGELHDTLGMAQALHPELPRDLGTLTSLYTLQPYYKDLGTLWKKDADYETYWRYNALDCACTIEIFQVLKEKLVQYDLWSVYERTRRVLPHAIDMACRGIKYDERRAVQLAGRADREVQRLQRILDGRAGGPINVNSHPQTTKLLYDTWGLPVRTNRETGGRTSNEKSLLSLYPLVTSKPIRQGIRALLGIRHRRKLTSAYLRVRPSSDNRMRSSYNPAGTETGRWSASKFLITEGVNLQTVPQAWKDCFVADDGMVFWYADYSQIEARLVSYLAGDTRSIRIFESGGDIHRENAAVIFRKTPDAITKRERDIGKSVHALNYGVGAETLMEFINKRGLETGVWVTKDLAKYIKDTYLSNFDQVVRWQEMTWATVQKTRTLTNPFGRRRIFLGPTSGQGSEHTKKEALAFVPQSTVPDLINEALVELREHPPVPGFEVLLNVHDALFGQGPEEGIDEWITSVLKAMLRPITLQPIGSTPVTVQIPVDIQIGYRWGSLKKWEAPR
jgi:uracil-DNA glycosylase family 4